MKKYLLIFLLINICSVQLFCQIEISTQKDFSKMEGSKETFVLANDIELSGWAPISSFSGTLDGNGFTITNSDSKSNRAIFAKTQNAKIQNLRYICTQKYEESVFSKTNKIIGGIVNESDESVFENCTSTVKYTLTLFLSGSQAIFGSIVGKANNTHISNCISLNSELKSIIIINGSKSEVGGIAGKLTGSSSIKNCIIINGSFESSGIIGGETSTGDFAGSSNESSNIEEGNTNAGSIPEKEVEDILNNNGNSGDTGGTTEPITLLTVDLSKPASTDESKIKVENKDGSIRIYNANETPQKIILKNNTEFDLDLFSFNGDVICSNSTVKKLIVGSKVKLGGNITTSSVELHDGCYICENGINNAETGEIIYYRNPSVFTGREGNGGDNTGWESISLPFNALIFAERNGETIELYPFGTTGKPAKCWIKSFANHELTPDNSFRIYFDTPKVLDAQNVIVANQPYLISFPGKAWGSKLNLEEATIYYKGSGKIINSVDQSKIYAGHSNSIKERDIRYVMNNPSECTLDLVTEKAGNQFVYTTEDILLKPFRASVVNLALQTPSGKAPVLKISYGPGSATQLLNPSDMELTIYASNGTIYIETEISFLASIWDATTGRIITTLEMNEGMNTISDLPKGVYIIEGKKIIL